jgi:hypothetical protein
MYSEEIDRILKQHGFNISNRIYTDICNGSNQITVVKYNPYESAFNMQTSDGWEWNFKVYYED